MEKEFIPLRLNYILLEMGCIPDTIFSNYTNGHPTLVNGVLLREKQAPAYRMTQEQVNRLFLPAILWQQAFDWLFQKYSLNLSLEGKNSYQDKIKKLEDAIRNLQNNKPK